LKARGKSNLLGTGDGGKETRETNMMEGTTPAEFPKMGRVWKKWVFRILKKTKIADE